jgi:general secretion pathway protein G
MSVMKLKKKAKKGKGFTLVELLVVVAILAILAAALLPKFLGYTDKAREAQIMADLSTMKSVVEIYAADEGAGDYPSITNVSAILVGKGIDWAEADGEVGDGIVDPYGNSYVYAIKGEPGSADQHFIIASPGKDGKFGNEAESDSTDDIYVTDNSGQPTKGKINANDWAAFVTDAGGGQNASASHVSDD